MYHVIGRPRTGTTILSEYAAVANKQKWYLEFFLDTYKIENGKIVEHEHPIGWNAKNGFKRLPYQVEQKFEYLENLKQQGKMIPFKIFPYIFIGSEYEDRLYDLVKDFKLLTIMRDPLDTFLSYSYQDITGWQTPHRTIKNNVDVSIDKCYIGIDRVKLYINRFKREEEFLSRLNYHHIFNYDDINDKHLQDFFGVKIKEWNFPMNIDYRSLIKNIDAVEFAFEELYHGQVDSNRI